ncbi:hypothetical protein ACK3TF_000728 [Chlorella vulgaris]
MQNRENEGDGFVSAADFFRQQSLPTALGAKGGADAGHRKPPRESLLVKSKIRALDSGGTASEGGIPAFGRTAAAAGLPLGRTGGPAGGAHLGSSLPPRATAKPALGAIAEETASQGLGAAAAPVRRHAAVVSTAGAPARRHAALLDCAALPSVQLPSPATKQRVAEKQHEARFPSIVFAVQQPTPPTRAPLPGGQAVQPPLPDPQLPAFADQRQPQHPHPLPGVLAPVQQKQQQPQQRTQQQGAQQPQADAQQQRQQAAVHQALAGVLAAEAAASVAAGAESEDEDRFMDADSGPGSGVPSNENSAVWADARDAPPGGSGIRCVLEGGDDDGDAASVASDASTVVPDHYGAEAEAGEEEGEEESGGQPGEAQRAPMNDVRQGWPPPAAQLELPEHAPLQKAASPAPLSAPQLQLCDSSVFGAEAEAALQQGGRAAALGGSAASELFQSATSQLAALGGSLDGPLFCSLPARRSSLSPAVSGNSRRSSLHVAATPPAGAPQLTESPAAAGPSVTLRGGMADTAASAPATQVANGVDASQQPQQQHSPHVLASQLQPLTTLATAVVSPPVAPVPAAEASAEGGSGLAAAAENSRVSLGGSSATPSAAPSLGIEFSEASLRYSVDLMLASSPSSHSPLEPSVMEAGPPPSHIANTSQQSRLSLPGSVPSPAVPASASALPALPSTAATGGEAGRWQQTPPANGMAVAPAAEQAAWGISATGDAAQAGGAAAARRASLTAEQQAAELDAERRASLPDPAAGGSPAAASPLPSGTPAARLAVGQAGSPALATPYAATEYDGEDVVMQDWDCSSPAPTTGRRPPPGSSRFLAETLAAASPPPSAGRTTSQQDAPAAQQQHREQGPVPGLCLAAEAEEAEQAETAIELQSAAGGKQQAEEQQQGLLAGHPFAAAQHGAAVQLEAQTGPEPQLVQQQQQQQAAGHAEQQAAPAAVQAAQAVSPPAVAQEAVRGGPAEAQAPGSGDSRGLLLALPSHHAAAHRGQSSRLSMPAGWQAAGAVARGAKASRLSLPSGVAAGGGGEVPPSGDAQQRLPAAAAAGLPYPTAERGDVGSFAGPEAAAAGLAVEEQRCQAAGEAQQAQRARQVQFTASQDVAAGGEGSPFSLRSRLPADDNVQQQESGSAGAAGAAEAMAQEEAVVQAAGEMPAAAACSAEEPAAAADGAAEVQSAAGEEAREEVPTAAAASEDLQAAAGAEQSAAACVEPWAAAAGVAVAALDSPAVAAQPAAAEAALAAAAAGCEQAAAQEEQLPAYELTGHEQLEAASQPAVAAVPALKSGSQEGIDAPGPAACDAKPKLTEPPAALSNDPALSRRSRLSSAHSRPSPAASDPLDDASAFAPRPRLSMSPAYSSGSGARMAAAPPPPAAASPDESSTPADALAATPSGGRFRGEPAWQSIDASHLPAGSLAAEQGGSQNSSAAQQQQQLQQQQQETAAHAAAVQPGASSSRRDSWSTNPLAGAAGLTPAAAAGVRRLTHSPAPSGLSAGAMSNNPMFAGTPGHPTPPSVNLRSFGGRASFGGTPQSASSGGSTPASVGRQLAEKMHQVAEQLQNPAAPQGLATLATPGGAARLAAGVAATPATGRFQFAADVEAMIQALDTRTPGTALGQQAALARATAVATTVQRAWPGREPRFSFAAGPATLLDLERFDADGDVGGQAGLALQLRQQLVGDTPAAAAGAASRSGRRLSTGPGAATPAEVRALREEVASLRTQLEESNAQREEAAGLLGGYQGSIRQLQDQHSVLVVRLQGELAAVKAERDDLRREHGETDSQFRTLYSEKYLPLKSEAAGLRQDVAALQKRAVSEELRAHKAASEVAAARDELAAAQQQAAGHQSALAEREAEMVAAREAQQRLQQQLAQEQRRAEKALAACDAELEDLRSKHGGLTRQYDEAVHRINLAKQARERAQREAKRKEEEVVALEVRLKQVEGALTDYKAENRKFFDMKERYKSIIAGLEKEVQAKEEDKSQLLGMCNDLMTRLEREGLSA